MVFKKTTLHSDHNLCYKCQIEHYNHQSSHPKFLPSHLSQCIQAYLTRPVHHQSAVPFIPSQKISITQRSSISQKSNGDISLHSGSKVDLDLKVQLDADLERAVLLLGVALVVEVRALDHCFADLVGRHGLDLLVGLLRHVFQVLSAAQGRACWVVEESSVVGLG